MECQYKNFNCKFCNPTILNPEFGTKCKICYNLPVQGVPDFKGGKIIIQKSYGASEYKGE